MKVSRPLRWLATGLGLLAIAVAVMAAKRANHVANTRQIPVATVKRGDLEVKIFTRGELRATRSATLVAPTIAGGTLKITRLLPTGTKVKAGDVVIEFDPSEQQYKLDQNRSEMLQAQQEIEKSKADAAVQVAHDAVELLKARFKVRQAELDVSQNEIASVIEAKKNDIALEQAKRELAQLEEDIKSHVASNQAGIKLALEKSHKAQLAMQQAQENIDHMRVRAPMDGLVVLAANTAAQGGMFYWGMTIPEYREGDQATPGSEVATIVDARQMEMATQVPDVDGGALRVGQAVEMQFDALPGQTFHGKVKTTGAVASSSGWFFIGGSRSFEVTVELADADARLRPGFTAQVTILGERHKDVLYLPRQAVLESNGKQVIYVKRGTGFVAQEIKIQHQNESRIAIAGLPEGTEVALLNPERAEGASNSGSNEPGFDGSAP
jgi:multidrug resistance efflux pump